jgi:predicted enzyme related to lactoylglutathione lyase
MSKFEGNAITWFEIPTADIDRATQFYETLLAANMIPFPGDEPCHMFPSGEASVGGCLIQRLGHEPSAQGTMVFLNVDGKLDDTLARATKLNSTILVPKTQVPGGYGFYACFIDSEGNHVGLHSR